MSILLRLSLSLSLLGATAGIAGLGAFASFTSSTSAVSQNMSAGTVSIAVAGAGTAENRLSIGASGLVPGDTVQRSVNLINSSTVALAKVTLTTTATNPLLANDLRMKIEKCSVPWSESASAPYTYSCPDATPPVVLQEQEVVVSNIELSNLTLNAAGTQYLRVTLRYALSSALAQGESSTIAYTFTATQRAGTHQ